MDFYLQQLRAHRQRLPPQVTYHCVDGALRSKNTLRKLFASRFTR